MKRVLEVAYPALTNSGVPAVIMGIIRQLHKECIFDIIIFRNEAGYHKEEFCSYGGNINIIDCTPKHGMLKNIKEKVSRPFRIYNGTKKVLSKTKYDVIHCHNAWDASWCLLAAKKTKIPVRICHSHASKNPFENDNLLIKLYKKISTKVINNSTTNRIGCSKIAAENLYGHSVKYDVIVNAVDLERFKLPKERMHINKDSPTFIFVGRLTKQKNPIFIINLFKYIIEEIKDAKLVIIGFGEMEKDIKAKILELGIRESVKLLDHSSNVPYELSKADYFLLPSFFEGLPVVLVEAQAMGLHCFVSDTVAKESDLGLCDFMSLSYGEKWWAKKICNQVNSYGSIKRLPNKKMMDKYSWDNVANNYRRIYDLEIKNG